MGLAHSSVAVSGAVVQVKDTTAHGQAVATAVGTGDADSDHHDSSGDALRQHFEAILNNDWHSIQAACSEDGFEAKEVNIVSVPLPTSAEPRYDIEVVLRVDGESVPDCMQAV